MKKTNAVRRTGSAAPASASGSSAVEIARRRISEIIQNERALRESGETGERLIQRMTRFSGSLPFISIHAAWFGLWIALNLVLPAGLRWDPYPFTFLTLVVSLEAIFLSAFILLTENREAAVAERRMHLDLQINLLAEQEDTKMFGLLRRVAEHLGVPPAQDPESKALAEDTDPSKILTLIDQCLKENGPASALARTPKP